jgi:hypothetical protein
MLKESVVVKCVRRVLKVHLAQLTLEELHKQQGKDKEGEKVMDKATDNNTVIRR